MFTALQPGCESKRLQEIFLRKAQDIDLLVQAQSKRVTTSRACSLKISMQPSLSGSPMAAASCRQSHSFSCEAMNMQDRKSPKFITYEARPKKITKTPIKSVLSSERKSSSSFLVGNSWEDHA